MSTSNDNIHTTPSNISMNNDTNNNNNTAGSTISNKMDNNKYYYYYNNNNNTKSSTTEKCGFIVHIFIILIGFLYYYNIGFLPKTIQLLTTTGSTTTSTISHHNTDTITTTTTTNTNTETKNDNTIIIINSSSISYFDMIGPIIFICILLAPIILYLLNKYIAMSSSYDSLETIYDDYNLIIQQQQQQQQQQQIERNDSTSSTSTTTGTSSSIISPNGTSKIAEIIDIDVGVINDLLSS